MVYCHEERILAFGSGRLFLIACPGSGHSWPVSGHPRGMVSPQFPKKIPKKNAEKVGANHLAFGGDFFVNRELNPLIQRHRELGYVSR
jgi:hypothetical protein